MDARRRDRAVLPPQPPARAARPQLVERRGPRRVRRHPALLVRPRCRRLPHRRVQHHRQGRGAARQPARDRRRPARRAAVRAATGLQREPARGPRRDAPLAADRRVPTTRRGCSSARRPSTTSRRLGAFYGADLDELQLAFNFPFINAPFEAAGDVGRSSNDVEASLPAGRVAGVDGLEPRHVALRDPLGARRSAPGARRAARCCSACGARPCSTRATRSASATSLVEPPDLRDPLGVRYWPAYAGRDAMRTPMHVARRARRRIHRPRTSGRGSRSATRQCNVDRANGPTRRRCSCSRATSSRCRRTTPDLNRRLVRRVGGARRSVGVAARRPARGRRELLRRRRGGRRCSAVA